MHRFILTLSHDKGTVDISTVATDAPAARQIIMKAERCPERSIRRVRAVSPEGYELDISLKRYRKLAVSEIRKSFSKNGQRRPDKVPMPWEVRVLDQPRWRRVYATENTGAHYVVLDNLNVMIELPKELP
jgi:hypothetical protein